MPTKLISYEHLFNEGFLQFDETFVNKIESSNFTYTANGRFKLRISKNRKWGDKKLRETTNLCIEIMNSKRQVMGKLGHVVQCRVCRLT